MNSFLHVFLTVLGPIFIVAGSGYLVSRVGLLAKYFRGTDGSRNSLKLIDLGTSSPSNPNASQWIGSSRACWVLIVAATPSGFGSVHLLARVCAFFRRPEPGELPL